LSLNVVLHGRGIYFARNYFANKMTDLGKMAQVKP